MSSQSRHTRSNPANELISTPNPEGILRRPSARTVPAPISLPPPSLDDSLLRRDLGSFINPPERSGVGVLYPSAGVWSPIASQLSSLSSLYDSLPLDQISTLSPTREHATLPRGPRRSLPGQFDPTTSFALSDRTAMEGAEDPPTPGLDDAAGPSPAQQTSIPSVEQVYASTNAMRAELDDLRRMMRDFMTMRHSPAQSAHSPPLCHPTTRISDSQGTAVPGARPTPVVHRYVSEEVPHQPMFASTPMHHDPFRPPAIPPTESRSNIAQPIHEATSAIDPVRFRITDFPEYKGKYGDVSAYRIWRHKVERLFKVKGVVLDGDKFDILPLLLSTDPAASWCRRSGSFEGHTWESVMKEMEAVVLPVDWLDKIKQQIRELAMKPNEHMSAFCARARVLQEAAGVEECSEEALAWAVVGGSTSLFRSIQQRDQLIRTSINPVSNKFSFAIFEQRACSSWDFALEIDPKHKSGPKNQSTTTSSSGTMVTQRPQYAGRPPLSSEDQAARNARFMAYMRSIGLCPRCKTSCPKWQGGCLAEMNPAYYPVPPDFPRSPPYLPPRPAVANRGVNPVTSRAPMKKVDVAGVEEVSGVDVAAVEAFPGLGRADVAAYEELLERLQGPPEDDLVEAAEDELDGRGGR